MIDLMLVLLFFTISGSEPLNRINLRDIYKPISMLQTRRILKGRLVGDTRPYMVYLRAAKNVDPRLIDAHWLCGGVIIHERHILTSAACIEDVERFYVISGTHKWIPPEVNDNECVINGARKAIWKCVPNSHQFDGKDFDNIRWMVSDIAIIRVEDDFNFERKILGCDFIPQKISLNNQSISLEKSGTIASIAGWGTTKRFTNIDKIPLEKAENSVDLLETDVIVISKKGCRKHWDERYHFIINNQMICTKDSSDFDVGSDACMGHEVNCTVLDDFDDDYFDSKPVLAKRRMIIDPNKYIVHTAGHHSSRKRLEMTLGGFCENDHGGPLVIGRGKVAMLIGIMSACQTKSVTQKCFGPFLFTSVYKYREIIYFCSTPALRWKCENLIQSSNSMYKEKFYDWNHHPDGTQKLDSSRKLVLRSYAQTPLHPIISPLVKEGTFKNNVSLTTAIQTLLKPQDQLLRNLFLNHGAFRSNRNVTYEKSGKNILPSVQCANTNTSQKPSKLKVSGAPILGNLVSPNSFRIPRIQESQNPKTKMTLPEVNHIVRASITKETTVDNVYMRIQQWQQNYLNYLNKT